MAISLFVSAFDVRARFLTLEMVTIALFCSRKPFLAPRMFTFIGSIIVVRPCMTLQIALGRKLSVALDPIGRHKLATEFSDLAVHPADMGRQIVEARILFVAL